MNTSNQKYCSKKIIDQSQLFGNLGKERSKLDLFAEDKFVGEVFKATEINLSNGFMASMYLCYSACSSDGRYLATNQTDHKIYVLDLETSKVVNVLGKESLRYISSLIFHPFHNHLLASGCVGGLVKIHDLVNNTNQELQILINLPCLVSVTSICFHPFEDILAIAIDNSVYFWFWKLGDKDSHISITTGDAKQKVKFVRFDSLGRLIIGISNNVNTVDPHQRLNNWISNLASNQTNSFPTSPSNNNNSSSNLNNLNNISLNYLIRESLFFGNVSDGDVSAYNALNIVNNDYQRNEFSQNQALFNLTNAITDSITQDHLLPENLPSYSFLQRNYRPENNPRDLFIRARCFHRRLEIEMNNDLLASNRGSINRPTEVNDATNDVINNEINIEINNQVNNNLSNESSEDSSNNSSSNGINQNDQELDVIMESINLVERLIRHRTTIQGSENNVTSNNNSESSTLNIYLNLSRSNRNYFLRRRLSSNRMTFTNLIESVTDRTSNINGATNDPTANDRLIGDRQSIFNIVSEPGATGQTQRNQPDQANLLPQNSQVQPNLDSVISLQNQIMRIHETRALLWGHFRSMAAADSRVQESANQQRSNSLTSNSIASLRESHSVGQSLRNQSISSNNLTHQPNDRLITQDRNRFYTLLQHQASRRVQSINNNSFFNAYSSTSSDQPQNPTESSTHQISILINQIQSSIDVINRASPQPENSEVMRQFQENSVTALNRLIYYMNYRDKLIQLRNRIRSMLEGNTFTVQLRYCLSQLLWLLIAYTDQMRRKLTNDLRFTQLSRLYLMRCSNTANNSTTNSINGFSNDSSNESLPYFSSSIDQTTEDDQPIPSTSTGIIKRKFKESSSSDNSTKKANKKFKIPEVKINNETDFMLDSNVDMNVNETNNRELLRTEIGNLLANMSRLSEASNSRVNNPMTFNSTNNQANNFPSFNVFIPAHQWANYNESNLHPLNNRYCRIQCFDFNKGELPDLKEVSSSNLIVPKCKILNDSSVDISKNGDLLCCLVPSPFGMDLCVYSLKKSNLGQCLFIYYSFSLNAISVSFSPSAKYILVGVSLPRYYDRFLNEERSQIAQIFVLSESLANAVKAKEFKDNAVELLPLKSIQPSGNDCFHLTSIKWLPTKDGIFYTNGQSLIIYRASGKSEPFYSKHMSNLTKLPSCIFLSSISPRSSNTNKNSQNSFDFINQASR